MENVDRCVCCGEIVPEGTMVCHNCQVTVTRGDEKVTFVGGQRGGGKIYILETLVKWLRKRLEEVEQERDRWKSAALYYMEKAKASSPRFLLKSDINVSEDMLKTLANSPVIFSTSEETIIPLMPGGWIPVTERLPEENEQVLVWTDTGSFIESARRDGRNWEVTWNHDPIVGVTHWMPLPEPPKEG